MNIYDIAKLANVSPATVSRVLNDNPHVRADKRNRVLVALQQSGYTPNQMARSLAGVPTRSLGILVTDIRHINYSTLAYKVERKASDMGYSAFLCNTTSNPEKQRLSLRMMHSKRVDCLILIGSSLSNPVVSKELDAAFKDIPTILFNNKYTGPMAYTVQGRFMDGNRAIMQHLHDLGHKNVVFINDGASWVSDQKTKLFKRLGRKLDFFQPKHFIYMGGSGYEAGAHAIQFFEEHEVTYTAVVAGDDITAVGVVHELQRRGLRVPDDISVVGYFNTLYSRICVPSLTTVDNGIEMISETICRMLQSALEGGAQPSRTTYINQTLLIRGSTGKVPNV